MDTTDPWIDFDTEGVCNHCRNFDSIIRPLWKTGSEGQKYLDHISKEIKRYGSTRDYDCIIGVSGGIDSSYLLYFAKEKLGLNPLAMHVDAGWNSEIAVRNIQNVTESLKIDLTTYVVNWNEMRDLQVAYLRSSLANQDVPQDHAFFAKLYEVAIEKKIKYVLTGSNFSTESILPRAWGYNAKDSRQIKAIHRRFGRERLRTFPISGLFKSYIYYPYVRGMRVITPLNYTNYNKDEAMAYLSENLGWEYYGGKHFESRWTKYFQAYFLPKKFGYDKRRAHLSSLIVSGQMSREDALDELRRPPFKEDDIQEDERYIAKKLGLSLSELQAMIKLPNKEFTDYPNSKNFEQFLRVGKRAMGRIGILK